MIPIGTGMRVCQFNKKIIIKLTRTRRQKNLKKKYVGLYVDLYIIYLGVYPNWAKAFSKPVFKHGLPQKIGGVMDCGNYI